MADRARPGDTHPTGGGKVGQAWIAGLVGVTHWICFSGRYCDCPGGKCSSAITGRVSLGGKNEAGVGDDGGCIGCWVRLR
jgi:hypothetical protein